VALEFRFPDIGEGIDAGELVEWHVTEGQAVCEDDPLADVQTDKALVTIPCPTSGRVLELRGEVGDTVPVGEVLAVFEVATDGTAARPLAAPAIRKQAQELGIDLATVAGSGPGGRIQREDLLRAAAAAPSPGRGGEVVPLGDPDRRGEIIPLRGTRRAIARTMTEAWRTIPHIIDYREVDATALLAWRDRLRSEAGDERLRRALTITPLLLRIAVQSLRRHPYVNASIDLKREEITLHRRYNIGIATAAPDGLVVPVVKQADTKTVAELALEVAGLSAAARERRLRPEQLTGGTFTLNNYGSLGVWLGTPIIKPGEVANFGIGRVQDRPVAVDGQVVVRPIVALAVSGDHRVLDGDTLGAFVSDVVASIEDPPATDT
jgi:pyruvate dehydrogenase E2 component (dihydrolipoamide acetyltransferase)